MAFVIKKVSEHGTSNPIVARLAVQTHEVIRFFRIAKDKQDRVLEIYINSVKPRLLHCMELSNTVTQEVEAIRKRILVDDSPSQPDSRVIELPQVPRLSEQAETYLYNAKSSLRDLALVFEPLFGVQFTHSRYNEILDRAEGQFGAEASLTKLLAADEPWIKRVVSMRNAVEHPEGKQGRLHILNFELVREDAQRRRFFQEPVWFLEGELPASLSSDMRTMLDNLLTFAEDLLVAAYVQLHPDSIVQFAQIPEADRTSECPVRLRAVLDQSKLKSNHAV